MSERIFYIDLFESFNSNYFWRDAFQTLGVVETFDCRQPTDALERRLLAFEPTHIHMGGSVKPGRSGHRQEGDCLCIAHKPEAP